MAMATWTYGSGRRQYTFCPLPEGLVLVLVVSRWSRRLEMPAEEARTLYRRLLGQGFERLVNDMARDTRGLNRVSVTGVLTQTHRPEIARGLLTNVAGVAPIRHSGPFRADAPPDTTSETQMFRPINPGDRVSYKCRGCRTAYGTVASVDNPDDESRIQWVRVQWDHGPLCWWQADLLKPSRKPRP